MNLCCSKQRFFVAAALVVAVGSGCRTPTPTRELDIADRLFVRGDHEAAAVSYAAAADVAVDSNEELRARFFALIARREGTAPERFDEALQALRVFAAEARSSQWGHLADLYADEMGQIDALRRMVLRAGADIAALEVRINVLEHELSSRDLLNGEIQNQLNAMKDERSQWQRSNRELEELLQTRAARLVDLEAELEALKRIDMQRTP